MIRIEKDFGDVHTLALIPDGTVTRIIYMLEPEKVMAGMEDLVCDGLAIVSVFGMDWDNDLTPWEAPNVRKKCPPFGGKADGFKARLFSEMIPAFEKEAGLSGIPSRSLLGLSLAGLFAVYAASDATLFDSIGSVSGSFWYDGFTDWLPSHLPSGTIRRFYFSIGDQEKNAKNQRFAKGEDETRKVVEILGRDRDVFFELNPGNHIVDGIPRLRKAIVWLSGRA